MSQWFSTQRATFRAMSEARSALIESNALDGAPIPDATRAQPFVLDPCLQQTRRGLYARRQFWRCTELYHRIADRIFGGGRYGKFVKACEVRYKKALANHQESNKKLQEVDEELFNLRILEQALKNPHFVVTPHTHQDR